MSDCKSDAKNSSAKKKQNINQISRDKMRSISSASSVKSIPSVKKVQSRHHEAQDYRKEIEIVDQPDQFDELKKSIIEADKKIEENKHPNNNKISQFVAKH